MPPQRNDEMRVFSTDKDVTNASNLLSSLKENLPFLDHGLGNIIVTQVEYCKCRFGAGSRWEHEFLIVTLEESVRARRTALLMVDRLNDDTKEYKGPGELLADLVRHQSQEMVDVEADVEANVEVTADSTDSNSSASSSIESSTTASPARALPNAQQWGTTNRFHRSGAKVKRITKGDPPNALDRLIVLPNRGAIARELGGCLYDVLMTMDLTQSQIDRPVALENFGHLLRTTSRNTPQYHFIFAQCYWYAYTIWKVLELETQPHIHKGALAGRQCSHSLTGYGQRLILGRGRSVNEVRTPETIKAEWDAEKVAEEEEWAQLKQQQKKLAIKQKQLAKMKLRLAVKQKKLGKMKLRLAVKQRLGISTAGDGSRQRLRRFNETQGTNKLHNLSKAYAYIKGVQDTALS
ncbi:uncharacterized protein BT62DRAFT_924739 [Guyanagaster necrorhizus]|uniref:Uncharacterized protein n=1 Tax=Guyanagaster necrorhizus TaxID=856835 RepID=A0A9P7VF46_9AGAR|nr:uncharacterized protein BT62DRAFT_924739 [Guyanagaster necrorhizus MCA 3950]KAG7439422.1 hypothetical protein BT62DRAFT_924739 [Guyanagaster necrorhizus MCA 3950]